MIAEIYEFATREFTKFSLSPSTTPHDAKGGVQIKFLLSSLNLIRRLFNVECDYDYHDLKIFGKGSHRGLAIWTFAQMGK